MEPPAASQKKTTKVSKKKHKPNNKRRSHHLSASNNGYFIRSLSAPMLLSLTGELCSRIQIAPGTTLTLGRSKHSCDIVFNDPRISRKHCQLQLLPDDNSLLLVNGSAPSSSIANKNLKTGNEGPTQNSYTDLLWKPSLNGIYVNGRAFSDKTLTLMPGDEVSLVSPSKKGFAKDSDCPQAVGFVVEAEAPERIFKKARPSSEVDTVLDNDGMSDNSQTDISDQHSVLNCNSVLENGNNSDNGTHNQWTDLLNHQSSMPMDKTSSTSISRERKKSNTLKMNPQRPLESVSQNTQPVHTSEKDVQYHQLNNVDSADSLQLGVNSKKHFPEKIHSFMDSDNRYVSVLNLVKKSMQLRFSVLAGYDNPPIVDTKVYNFVTSQETLAICDTVNIVQGNLLEQAIPSKESIQFNNVPEVCEAITAIDTKESMTNLEEDIYCPIKKQDTENLSSSTENFPITQNCNDDRNMNISYTCSRSSSAYLRCSAEGLSEKSGSACKDNLNCMRSQAETINQQKGAMSKSPEKQMNESMIDRLPKGSCTNGLNIIGSIAEPDTQKVDSDTQLCKSYSRDAPTENFHIVDANESYCKMSLGGRMAERSKFCPETLPATCIDICQITIENEILLKSGSNLHVSHVADSSKRVNEEDQALPSHASAVETEKPFTKVTTSTFIDIGQIIIEDQIMVDHKFNTTKPNTMLPKDKKHNKKVIENLAFAASVVDTDTNIETEDGHGKQNLTPHQLTVISDFDAKRRYNVEGKIPWQANSQKVEFQEEYLYAASRKLPSENDEKSKYQEFGTNSNSAEDNTKMQTYSKAEDVQGQNILSRASDLDAKSCSSSRKAEFLNKKDEASDAEEIATNRISAVEDISSRLLGSLDLKNKVEVSPAKETNHASQNLFFSYLELCEDEAEFEEILSHEDVSVKCFSSNVLKSSIPNGEDTIKSDDVSVNKVLFPEMPSKNQDQDGEDFMTDSVDKRLDNKEMITEEQNCKTSAANHVEEVKGSNVTKLDTRMQDACEQDSDISLQNKRTHIHGYYLNRLQDLSDSKYAISLQDLLAPICDIQGLFIATFTYDVEWFLSFCGIPTHIPVTVACHDSKKCWSSSVKDRCEKSNEEWPNLTLVFPPFPKSSAIGKGKGIGCHHPKLFLVYRVDSIRVVVSSANLNFRQWFHISNNVWWQDFPRRQSPDFRSLFQQEHCRGTSTTCDFASQLAHFLAALLTDAPSEAHWITDLAAYDFTTAMGSLVSSVPGIHYPLYQNAPNFLMTLEKESCSLSQYEDDYGSKNLGIITTTVAGMKYRFGPTTDKKGTRIRALAAILKNANGVSASTMPVLLKRAKFLKADPNAVSVVVTSQALECSQDLFLQEDLHNEDINTMEVDISPEENNFVKLGFLPKDVAHWLSVLCDRGFFSFAACIWPTEALAVASGQSDESVKLALYVFEGPKFSELANMVLNEEELAAVAGLIKSLHNMWGMWRLEKVLSKYKWNDAHESDFLVASSSIGTSLDAQFLAAFAAAAGRRSDSCASSQDSDPEWGCWTAEQESINPSIGIVFPCIERVKRGDLSLYNILCFSENAWLRLKPARLLHDAVPNPPERDNFPMHIKIARRRFQQSPSSRPYGWLYCGSHNFSPAAWGRPLWKAADYGCVNGAAVLGSSLQISNYELGIVFMEPPDENIFEDDYLPDSLGIDKFLLPFQTPPPPYKDEDRPATGKAMNEALLELQAADEALDVMESEVPVEDEANNMQLQEFAHKAKDEEEKAEEEYVVALWSQIDDPNE